jgi:hypothetical protein
MQNDTTVVLGDELDMDAIQEEINKRFMLVSMKVRKAPMERQDKKTARDLARSKGADEKAVKVEKSLWGAGWAHDRVAAVNKIAHRANTVKAKFTKPWGINSDAILPNVRYMEFAAELAAVEAEMHAALAELEPHYNRMCADARQSLNTDLAADVVHPTWEQFKACYSIEVAYAPVPTPSDAGNLNVETQLAQVMVDRATKARNHAVEEMQRGAWEMVIPELERLISRTTLREDKNGNLKSGRIYDSLIQAQRDLVSSLRHFNITNDPALERIRQKLADAIDGVTADTLRGDVAACEDVNNKAKEIAAEMAAMGW